MKVILIFLQFVFALNLMSCCQDKVSQTDSNFINTYLVGFKSIESIDTLFELGLYTVAHEVITKDLETIPDSVKLHFAYLFANNGEFDKGSQLMNKLTNPNYTYDVLNFSLTCALKKEDNILAEQLFDSLTNQFGAKLNIEKKVSLMLSEAYLEHNKENYKKSIQLNEQALKIVNEKNLPEKYRLRAHRLLGNDYNDIVRMNIPFPTSKKLCYQKGMSHYEQELEILLEDKYHNNNQIALNRITTAMLMRTEGNNDKIINLYAEALELLVVLEEDNFMVARNPVYASIALTQLGTIYFELGEVAKMDSILSLNKKLIALRSYYKINGKQSLDIWEYFSQESEERQILAYLKDGNESDELAIKCLGISSNSKYINHNLDRNILKLLGGDGYAAVKNWIILKEWSVYQYFRTKSIKIDVNHSKLVAYDSKIKKINAQKVITVDKNKIESLKRWCSKNDATIIDLQVLFEGSISKIIVDKNGVSVKLIKRGEILSAENINLLLESIKSSNIISYQKISNEILNTIDLGSISTKNLIICPDDFLEKIPFDALVLSGKPSKNWSNLLYFGKHKNIRLVPNLFFLSDNQITKPSLKVDFWYSEGENKTLPYNEILVDAISDEFPTTINHSETNHILHILGHTYFTKEKRLEFRLDRDTISPNSIGDLHPVLAILHGCSSGNGKMIKLEGSISITRGFLYNGTNSVIYSIWEVDNQSSAALFKHFYENIKNGYSTSIALNKAKNDLINDYRHPDWANPYHWANFQFTGQELLFAH